MGERTSHAPGTFSWVDVSTTDQEGAKRFYQELFGWEADDVPAGEGIVYSMMKLDGRSVAAISPQQEQQREMGVPPVWNSYVTVEEADAAANKAKELGANLFAEPFDVFDAGRMAVIQDPQGAVFMVWEPRESIGAELVNVPGALTLNQLNTSDPEAAGRFYGDLFGWRIEQVSEEPEQPYWGIYNGDRLNGGMMGHQGPAPPHWLPYFASEDVDAASAKIAELGGNVIIGPMDIPSGRIAVAQDPQGAYFALFAGRFDD